MNSKPDVSLLLYENCDVLRDRFLKMKSSRDVAKLLNVEYKRLVYHLYKFPASSRYTNFEIPKKSRITNTNQGTKEKREIQAPNTSLKLIQRKLSQVLYSVYQVKTCVHGFVPARSILTNARVHKKKRWILNIDLESFFKSINFGRVRGMFMAVPYECNSSVATVLAQICCYNNSLPQGAPTSPIVSNMICAKLDSQLKRLAQLFRCTYTRYADDITFSTTRSEFPKELASVASSDNGSKVILGEVLVSTIASNGFQINQQKTRLQSSTSHQEVTGLTVNRFPNLDRRYIRQIRAMLHNWERFGLEAVEMQYTQRYQERFLPDSPPSFKNVPSFKSVLRGKIDFLGMVRGKDNPIYWKYITQYRRLSKRDESVGTQQHSTMGSSNQ